MISLTLMMMNFAALTQSSVVDDVMIKAMPSLNFALSLIGAGLSVSIILTIAKLIKREYRNYIIRNMPMATYRR